MTRLMTFSSLPCAACQEISSAGGGYGYTVCSNAASNAIVMDVQI